MHWAHRSTDEKGRLSVTLFPAELRPTFEQFRYWGKKGSDDKSVADILLGDLKFNRKKAARGGSLQDQVNAVGQLGVFDSTSTDVYLASVMARLRKLPPMTRLVAQDVRSELIYGLYCGWKAPSPATALQAILNGASPKPAFCRRFGIEITEDEWPHQLARTVQADNGELKAAVPTDAEVQFGFSITYTRTNSGDSKGGIESSHKSIHRELDHQLPGSTKGKRSERGEEHAANSALWNYFEYMHELIRAILKYNDVERLDLAPVEMLREIPSIKPTRLNIFHWLRRQGMSVDIPVDLNALQGFTLPDCKAVVRKNGVYLLRPVHGHETVLPKLRYTSPELVASGLMQRVKASGDVIRTTVKMDEANPAQAWLPTKIGMIPLQLAGSDSLLKTQLTVPDWVDYLEDRAISRLTNRGATEQLELDKYLRRDAVTKNAKTELRKELSKAKKPPSKTSIKKNLRSHRDQEMALLHAQDRETQQRREVVSDGTQPDISSPQNEILETKLSAADLAMRKLNDEEFGNDHA